MLGVNIRTLRKQRGWTQERLANKIRKDSTTVTKIETGVAKPSLDTLEDIAKAFGVPLAELLGEGERSGTDRATRAANY